MNLQKLRSEIKERVGDPRRTRYGNVKHTLETLIIIGVCTIMCGGEDYVDMETFGVERLEWFQKIIPDLTIIPDSDTFRRTFERLNPSELSNCLYKWLDAHTKKEKRQINIDGKTICGSRGNSKRAVHVVSAWANDMNLTLGEIAVDEKSNEITAVPELLDMIDVDGCIVTADAMSCQRKIVEKVAEKKADYVIALKANQENLYDDVKLYFEDFKQECKVAKTFDGEHGRREWRSYYLETDIDWLYGKENWKSLAAIGMVHNKVEEKGVERHETRYYITSLVDVEQFALSVRGHWSIENRLHWMLDVALREDAAKAKKDNSPLNMNVLRKVSLHLLQSYSAGRLGVRKKMFKAALNPEVMLNILLKK